MFWFFFQVMKEVQSALNTAAADDSKLVLFSAVGSIFCCVLDFIYFIRRLTDDRKKESTKMAEAIRYVRLSSVTWVGILHSVVWLVLSFLFQKPLIEPDLRHSPVMWYSVQQFFILPVLFYLSCHFMHHSFYY